MIGTGELSRTRRQKSSPLIPGITRSRMIRSGISLAVIASAASPSSAVTTSYPAAARLARIVLNSWGSSSTTNTTGCLFILLHRHELGDILILHGYSDFKAGPVARFTLRPDLAAMRFH